MGDTKKLAHTQWNCKYHIVFAPKYRRQVFYGEKKRVIGEILRKLCEWKGVNIVEAECCPDHIHMLLEIPPKMSVSAFVGYLKGKSSLMIYEQFGELKFKYRNREFWCRGYYVDTVGKNKAKIAEYIRHQLSEDKLGEQLSIPYAGSPFTGRRQSKCRCQTVHAPARARLVRKPYRRIRGTTGYAGGAPLRQGRYNLFPSPLPHALRTVWSQVLSPLQKAFLQKDATKQARRHAQRYIPLSHAAWKGPNPPPRAA